MGSLRNLGPSHHKGVRLDLPLEGKSAGLSIPGQWYQSSLEERLRMLLTLSWTYGFHTFGSY